MKHIFTLLGVLLLTFQANSQCTDLFFSEYIEGSSNNKALEIFNPTDNPIDLATYKINRYNGGVTTPSGELTFPTGTMIAAGDVYVISNAQSDSLGILVNADTTSGITFYNGDDAIELQDTVTLTSIDIIGRIGEDPGSEWPVGSGSTKEYTLVRKADVNDGETDWTLGALQWDVYPQDSFTFIGAHTINSCDVQVQPPVVTLTEMVEGIVESAGSATVGVAVSNLTSDVSFDIVMNAASTAGAGDATVINLGSYSFSEGDADTTITVTINVIDDAVTESAENIIINLTNVTTADVIVTNDMYTLNILDDDVSSVNPCGNIFFSEYIEGSSNNKALEVYNPTNDAIDLGKYKINRYNNGNQIDNVSGVFDFPAGFMLAAGDVYVIANGGSDSLGILVNADTTSSITFFNGDDALELVDTTDDTQLDIIGVIGIDPGSSWDVGTGGTANFTLVRKETTNEGFTNWAASTLTWDVYPTDSFTFIGSHTMLSCEPEVCENITVEVTATVTNESSLGLEDGAIDISVTGGAGPYTFAWSNSSTDEDISDLAPGDYTVVATSSEGCIGTATFTVDEGADACASVVIEATAVVTDESVLGSEDGDINATVTGGTAPYTYLWSNGETTEDIDNLAGGDYILTSTDVNGCTGLDTFTVAPGVDPCAAVTIEATAVITDETTLGLEDGDIDATVTGGTAPYTYLWSNGETTEDIDNLAGGDYILTSTDANGCSGIDTFTVAPGTDPCASVTITVTGTATDESSLGLEDGAIDASVSGGAGGYTYSWDNGETTEDISDLAPGDYTLTATDMNGCSGSETFTVAAGADPCASVTITATLVATDESVSGAEDGAIDATITGGTAPYTFAWDNGATTEDISDLAPGDYMVTVTDANGCTGTATETIEAGAVGVNEIASLNRFSVYPNPVSSVLNVELKFNSTELVQLQIVDVMGRIVTELNSESLISKTYTLYPELPTGIYFLKVIVDNSFAIEPFIVQ